MLSGAELPPVTTGAMTLAALRRRRLLVNYDALWFILLASAAVFEAMLVFDGRYRDAPMAVFLVPVVASVLWIWTRDKPRALGWEEILAANALALLAIVDAIMEGAKNLDFVTWNVAAVVLAAPVIMAQEGKRAIGKVNKRA